MTVILQAAISGESGEEWSTLHCNTEYSHGIMWQHCAIYRWDKSQSGELIVSKYVAESITMIAGRFGLEGLCQLRTELKKLQCEIGYIAKHWPMVLCDVEWVHK